MEYHYTNNTNESLQLHPLLMNDQIIAIVIMIEKRRTGAAAAILLLLLLLCFVAKVYC